MAYSEIVTLKSTVTTEKGITSTTVPEVSLLSTRTASINLLSTTADNAVTVVSTVLKSKNVNSVYTLEAY